MSTATGFSVELRLRVLDDTVGHNQFDAPIAFLGGYATGDAAERAKMIYFDDGAVGWADDSQSFTMDTPSIRTTWTSPRVVRPVSTSTTCCG